MSDLEIHRFTPADADETIRRAIEIRDGVVVNRDILSFQHRAEEYPHVPR